MFQKCFASAWRVSETKVKSFLVHVSNGFPTTNASDKETKKQINQRSTEQHNSQVSNQACPFIVPAFTVSTSSWLTAKLADSADWSFGQSFEEWSERKGLGSCANYCWTLCRHCTHFLCPHWGSAWGFYHAGPFGWILFLKSDEVSSGWCPTSHKPSRMSWVVVINSDWSWLKHFFVCLLFVFGDVELNISALLVLHLNRTWPKFGSSFFLQVVFFPSPDPATELTRCLVWALPTWIMHWLGWGFF